MEGGALEVEPEPRAVKFFDRTRGRAFVHPASVLFNVGRYQSGWVAYTQMSETSKLYVREASMVPVFSLLLFGGALRVEHEQGLLVVDDWMEFKAPASMGVLVRQLRAELDRELLLKIADPDFDLAGSKVVAAMMELLSSDGF